MTKQGNDNQGLVPKLRFPKFRDAGEWSFKPLKALAKRKTKRNADESVVRVLTNSAEHGVIDQKDYFDKDIAVQGNLESYFVVALGDYVYNPRVSVTAPVGPIGKNKIGLGVMSPLYTVFGFNCEDEFYEHFFRSSLWHPYMRFVSNSGARHDRMAVSADDFMAMPVPAPLLAEQQKIAECLSSLDALIAADTDKLAALRDHKKGLMQQLLPAEGETVPRVRFSAFRDAGEWTKAPAGQLFSNRVERGNARLPIYSVTMNDGLLPRASLDRKIDETDNASSNKLVKKGDIAYNMMRMWQGALGVAPEDCMVSPAYIVLKPIANANPGFFSSVFKMPMALKVLREASRGLTEDRLRLYYDDFSRINLVYPSLPEQKAIADCLSSVDLVISNQIGRINALKACKNGLMQQLFLSPAEAVA